MQVKSFGESDSLHYTSCVPSITMIYINFKDMFISNTVYLCMLYLIRGLLYCYKVWVPYVGFRTLCIEFKCM